jgi:putative tricarboxylic transport membrane protein
MDSRKDLILALGAMALGIFVIAVTCSFPQALVADTVGPRAFPFGLGALFLICGGAVTIQRLRAMNAAGGFQVASEGNDDEPEHQSSALRAAAFIAVTFGYAALLKPLGFILATPIFLIAAFAIMKERNWLTVVGSAIIYTVLAYLLFEVLLDARLPKGLLAGVM